jgi:hypothetical protein
MSRIPKVIVSGILLIVLASLLTRHYYVNIVPAAAAAESASAHAPHLPTNSIGTDTPTSIDTLSYTAENLVGEAREGALNYWNAVLDKYKSVTGTPELAGTGTGMAVSDEERQNALSLWGGGPLKASPASPAPPPDRLARPGPPAPAPLDADLPMVDPRVSSDRTSSLTSDMPIVDPRVSSSSSSSLTPSDRHVANLFEEATTFLTYNNDNDKKQNTVLPTVGKPDAPTAAGEKKQKARAEAPAVTDGDHTKSKDPPVNMKLVIKYSQRAHYQHNATSSAQGLEDEKDFPKLHVCVTAGEAYGAAWLATRRHLVDGHVADFNLTWVNCEMASFTVMGHFKRMMKPSGAGVIVQTLDVLDLSVLHLSTYERSHKRYQTQLWADKKIRKTAWHNIDPVVTASRQVETDVKRRVKYGGKQAPRSAFSERTIVVMPFLGGAMGAGHSVLSNRYHYLRACFWSIYEFFPHIVMAVTQESDVKWGKENSEMPWFDVVLLENLPKSASLPMATVQYTRRMLLSKKWDFDYVYYTESDQVLMLRNLESYRQYLEAFPLRVLVPHRLMTYPQDVMEKIHKRTKEAALDLDVIPVGDNAKTVTNLRVSVSVSASPRETINDWRDLSCCMPRQNCLDRKGWVGLGEREQVPLMNYSGMIIPLGNSNFLDEIYRTCVMMPKPLLGETSFCP